MSPTQASDEQYGTITWCAAANGDKAARARLTHEAKTLDRAKKRLKTEAAATFGARLAKHAPAVEKR